MGKKKKNKNSCDNKRPTKRAMNVISARTSDTDPEGSYTGVCENKSEVPVQDADDL